MDPTPLHQQNILWVGLKLTASILIVVIVANLVPEKAATLLMTWSILGFISFPIQTQTALWKHFLYSPIIGCYEVFDRIHQKLSSK